MQLSPEEKRRIYEEEKTRMEAEQKQRMTAGGSSTGLEPNVAALLCYLGFWITGIIFLVIEQQNRFVRFHALQSIVTFGALTVAAFLLGWIPFVGPVLRALLGVLVFVLWIVLMIKAHQGELHRVPLAGQVAEGILPADWRVGRTEQGDRQETSGLTASEESGEPPESGGASSPSASAKADDARRPAEGRFARTRGGRVAGYGVAIFFNLVFLVFFTSFHRYIAWYHTGPDGTINRLPLLTGDYFTFLPVLVTALVITIAAYVVMIIHDNYWLHEVIHITLAGIGVAVIVNLLAIFPFDFGVIPDPRIAAIMPGIVTAALVVVAVALGISALVRFIRLMVRVAQ